MATDSPFLFPGSGNNDAGSHFPPCSTFHKPPPDFVAPDRFAFATIQRHLCAPLCRSAFRPRPKSECPPTHSVRVPATARLVTPVCVVGSCVAHDRDPGTRESRRGQKKPFHEQQRRLPITITITTRNVDIGEGSGDCDGPRLLLVRFPGGLCCFWKTCRPTGQHRSPGTWLGSAMKRTGVPCTRIDSWSSRQRQADISLRAGIRLACCVGVMGCWQPRLSTVVSVRSLQNL